MIDIASITGNTHPNEDTYGYTENVYWVIDGATRPNATVDVSYYAKQLSLSLAEVFSKSSNLSLQEGLYRAIEKVSYLSSKAGIPSATIALARQIEGAFEWLVLGDAAVATPQVSFSDMRLSNIAVQERAHLQTLQIEKASVDKQKEAHQALLRAEDFSRNTSNGFWVAANKPEAAYQAIVGSIQTNHLALMTDGAYNAIQDNFWVNEFEAFKVWDKVGLQNAFESYYNHLLYTPSKIDDITALLIK